MEKVISTTGHEVLPLDHFKIKPSEWAEYERKSEYKNARHFVWHLMGYHVPTYTEEQGCPQEFSVTEKAVDETLETLMASGLFESYIPDNIIYRQTGNPISDSMHRMSATMHRVSLPAIRRFYEANQSLGRPPLLFKEERSIDGVSDVTEVSAKRCDTPEYFIRALIGVLTEIAWRAGKANIEFKANEMPGIKNDLHALFVALNLPGSVLSESTFSDYLKRFCQFGKGARSTDFYKKLFQDVEWK